MGFLKSSRKVNANNGSGLDDRLAERIAGGYRKTQKMFASKMNKSIGSMSNGRLKLLVVLFCIVAGGYSAWLIITAAAYSPKREAAWHIEQIKRPSHLDKAGDEKATADVYVNEETFRQIQLFQTFMDSLRGNNRRHYDSIVLARPHLMDSVLLLERLYQLQKQ